MASTDFRAAPFILLDDSRAPHLAGDSYLFHSPEHIITARTLDEVGAALAAMDAAYAAGLHLAGWIAYEVAAEFEPRLAKHIRVHPEEPLIWMMATHHRIRLTPADLKEQFHQSSRGNERRSAIEVSEANSSRAEYLSALNRVQNYIAAGDVYQVNHTFPLPVHIEGDTLALYRKLRSSQPVPYGAYIDTGAEKILSLSPELFVEKIGANLTAKPMKGTAPRGRNNTEDQTASAFLKNDEKSIAENLMIVDLIRNDLSRIAQPGTVSVPALFETEKYPTLHQMTSTVTAEAVSALEPSQLLAAMFPCGSVTGAPKVRAMEIIQALETEARGIYCGTIGHFSPPSGGRPEHWALNVPIRTLCLKAEQSGRLNIGSGIVADSNPAAEYEECLLKAAFVHTHRPEFCLIETMRLEARGYSYLRQHLERLESSALYFDFAFNRGAVEQNLKDHAAAAECIGALRCRLLLDQSGNVSLSSNLLDNSATLMHLPTADPQNTATVCLSQQAVNSGDIFLHHKTTHRRTYDEAFQRARLEGHADILFFNEHGLLTEGAISSIFVRNGTQWYTPPTSDGLLPGILRAELLKTNEHLIEQSFTRADLLAADAVYIGNALRGLRLVEIESN